MPNNLRIFLVIAILCSGVSLRAQSNILSPYSLSGIGELKFTGFHDHKNMGGVSRAIRSSSNYSPLNPASYTAMSNVVYNAGASMSLGNLESSSGTAQTNFANMNYFSMGFAKPNQSTWGVSFGFYQLSEVGYDIRAANQGDSLGSYNLFNGQGGISTAYAGVGISPVKNLSLGANINYNFGSIESVRAQVYPIGNSHFSFSDENYLYYSGFNFDFGVQYTIRQITKNDEAIHHVFGASFHTATKLNGEGYRYTESFFGRLFEEQGIFIPIDTLIYNDSLTKQLRKPQSFGLAYSVSKPGHWVLSAEYERGLWSKEISELNNEPFFDQERYSFGLGIVPNPDYRTMGNYFSKVQYSAGIRYEKLYYNFFGQQIDELGIGFGLGLPIVKTFNGSNGKVAIISRVNLGVEYSQRGTTENNLIKENYLHITIGLNFNDKWFIPRKYQ